MVIVYNAGNISEAHIIKGMLEANGIEAHVGGHYLQGGIGDLAVMDFAKVQVADEDVLDAREVIKTYENNHVAEDDDRNEKVVSNIPLVLAIVAIMTILIFALALQAS